ncbi:MAG: D-alanyl-D-alanine carboxypeptidase/D-alanyl-D-alanine-endopeptidase [Pseudomonadota bacterium]
MATAPLTSLRPQPRPGSIAPGSAKSIVAAAKLTGTTTLICTRADGTVVDAIGKDVPLPPASVAKAVTALYAVDSLGRDYRFATVVLGTGPIVDGVLEGDLILRGTGDPLLDTDALGLLADELRQAGIKRISGKFLVYAGDLPEIYQIDESQLPWVGYNPSISGLNLNYNRVHFEWRRSGSDYTISMEARARIYQPAVGTSSMGLAEATWPTYTHRLGPKKEFWTVAKPALGGGGARWLPVRRPEAYAADVFRTLARSMGVNLPEAETDQGPVRGVVLASHVSPSARGMCGGMLKYSTNLTAEVLGLRASQARGTTPASLSASARQMNAWAAQKFGSPMGLVDHSGLGDGSRVSVGSLAKMLGATNELSPMLKEIVVKNERGEPVEDAPYGIRAKTGTLNFVNALAGYVMVPDREPLNFAIISSDLPRRASLTETEKERPTGAKGYARRARALQQALIARWVAVAYDEA